MHLILAPRGTLRRKTALYERVHRELRASLNIPEQSKRVRKFERHIRFVRTGELA